MRSNLRNQVTEALKNDEFSRNNDIRCMLWIWKKHYGVDGNTIELSQLYHLPTQDNIKRIRAQIQNEQHLYLPTSPTVIKQRRINEQAWRQGLGYAYNENLELNEYGNVVPKSGLEQTSLL